MGRPTTRTKGQAPDGGDANAGYECDRNQGIGKMNPAHTGCTTSTTSPTPQPTRSSVDVCPDMPGKQSTGTTCSTPSPSTPPTPKTCPDGSTMPAGGPSDCPKKDDKNDGDKDDRKVTICHATGSETNPFVVITVDESGLNGHGKHEDDILATNGVCPGGTGGGGGTTPGTITICHATGSASNPYVVITISTNGLNGHGDHEGDIIPMPAGGCPTAPVTTPDACPDLDGRQLPGTSCTPPTTGTGGGGGTVDVCPDVPGMQTMAPCVTNGGGTTVVTPPADNAPIGGVTPTQPATGPNPMGPPSQVPPAVVQNSNVPPALIGNVTSPATRPAATRPRALPFTGTDMALLVELAALLLLAGGGVLLAARRERTARAS